MPLIVIVDDRATNRTIYSRLALSIGEGVKVRAFADPGDALKWLGRNRPDLIVTDYDMPQINGEEFISRFRGLPHSAGVPIMMITVNDQRKLRLRALESGATDFLNTPIDHCEFRMRARNLLKLSQDAETRAEGGKVEANADLPPTVVRDEGEGEDSAEARQFLAQCGEAGAYALHVIALDDLECETVDPAGLAALLRWQLRCDDVLAHLDRKRFAILQRNVVDPADAGACARRLSGLRGAAILPVGTALPEPGPGAPDERAAACLAAATALARRRDAPPAAGAPAAIPAELGGKARDWRFLPRVDLRTGTIVGAQLQCAGAPAEVVDSAALSAALACVASLRVSRHNPARFSLKLGLAGAGASAAALRLAPILSKARVSPARLDLQICAREALVDSARAEAEARALKALGMSLTLDLAVLGPRDLREGDQWAALLGPFIGGWCDAIKFPCGENRAVPVARLLRMLVARRVGRVPRLLADGVRSAELLEPLLRAGASQAQGACFGEPFSARDLRALFAARDRAEDSSLTAHRA